MEIKISITDDNIKIIKLIGDFDGNTVEKAKEEIIPHINSNKRLIFDMSSCKYISSAGLRVLLIIAKKIKTVGGYGVLTNLMEEVKDVMEMTGFSHILKSYKTIDEAIIAVKEKG